MSVKKNNCCNIESVVNVDERGQMILPKELREKAGIKAGDKIALVSWNNNGGFCCITMVKADQISEIVGATLGPILSGSKK
jgi:AbrB family looped-hinge helix DNA binding protein